MYFLETTLHQKSYLNPCIHDVRVSNDATHKMKPWSGIWPVSSGNHGDGARACDSEMFLSPLWELGMALRRGSYQPETGYVLGCYTDSITVGTLQRRPLSVWRLKSPTTRLFVRKFSWANNKENTEAAIASFCDQASNAKSFSVSWRH